MNSEKLSQPENYESNETLEPRHATRTVLLDDKGQVAIINVKKHGYYKIPGGGIEDGEDISDAARREVKEESGCDCTIIDNLGRLENTIPTWGILDISDGLMAIVSGEKSQTNYEDYEKERGFEIEWFENLDSAIETIENNIPTEPGTDILQERDLTFLKLAREKLAQSDNQ